MENEKRKIGEYEVISSIHIGDKELILAENMNDENKLYYLTCEVTNNGLLEKYDNAIAGDDFSEIAEEFSQRLQGQVQQIKNLYAMQPEDKTLIDNTSCIPLGQCRDLTDCVVVLDASYFRPEYRIPTEQIYIVKSGSGVKEHSFGTAVYCDNLYSGKHTRLERYEFYGILKPECYPEWVKDKLQKLEIIKNNPTVFEYAQYHFLPVGTSGNIDVAKDILSDRTMGVWNEKYNDVYGNGIINYSHEDFYRAANNIQCDVFMCVENGKNYLPANNELFEYVGNYEKYQAPQQDTEKNKVKKHEEVER